MILDIQKKNHDVYLLHFWQGRGTSLLFTNTILENTFQCLYMSFDFFQFLLLSTSWGVFSMSTWRPLQEVVQCPPHGPLCPLCYTLEAPAPGGHYVTPWGPLCSLCYTLGAPIFIMLHPSGPYVHHLTPWGHQRLHKTVRVLVDTILWLQQAVRSSCSSSMFNGIRLEPTNKRFNSAYLQNKYLICRKIHSNTF